MTGCAGGVCSIYEPDQQCITKDVTAEHEVARMWLPVLLLYSRLLHVARHLPQ